MRKFLLMLLGIYLCNNINAQSADEQAVRQVLATQSAAWNEGNLEKFMVGYWQHDSLMFIGAKGVVYGYKNTLERYKKTYVDAASMGKLQFTLLHINPLCKNYYSVVGKWHLTRKMGDAEGHFTLIFKKINGRWLIIQDHSS